MRRRLLSCLGLSLLPGLLAIAPVAAQDTLRLSLPEALALGREGHPAVAQARAERAGREADLLASSAAWLPRLTAEWGVMRSNDPVAAFGGKLRQGIFSANDLALPALNFPPALTDVTAGVTIEQPLFQPEALLGRSAARAGVRAAALAEGRTSQVVSFDIIRAYYGARLAADRVTVIQVALDAARETAIQVGHLRTEGLVTVVDEELVRVRVSELEAGLASARSGQLGATDLLLELLGKPPGQPVLLSDDLALPGGAGPDSLSRDDLAALRAGLDAQDANLRRARSQWIPSVGAFGTLAWHDGDLGLAGGPHRWTAGLVVRWTPFAGLADVGRLNRARADRDAAQARLEAANRHAQSEVRMARAERDAAMATYDAAEAALAQSGQAVRAATSRYAEGVATITELLAVRAAESSQRLARLQALYQARLADAALVLALGGTPQ